VYAILRRAGVIDLFTFLQMFAHTHLPTTLVCCCKGMKKWITSNYHYMVPECDETSKVQPDFSVFFANIKRGKTVLGADCATPVIVGPISMARFKIIMTSANTSIADLVKAMIPVYTDLLNQVAALGFSEVQILEPALVFAERDLMPLFALAYPAIIGEASKKLAVNMVSFMDDVGEDNYQWLIAQPEIRVISMDFSTTRGGKSLDFVAKYGFPDSKTLGAGVIDARNVWKVIPEETTPILAMLASLVANICIQPSGSLQYCPWDFEREGDVLKGHPATTVLAFAKQKIDEVALVATAVGNDSALNGHKSAWTTFQAKRAAAALSHALESVNRIKNLSETDFARAMNYKARRPKQLPGLPALPTTTIGSFPQTTEIRRLRGQIARTKPQEPNVAAFLVLRWPSLLSPFAEVASLSLPVSIEKAALCTNGRS
jgi:5-methyltetrahydropteroyltriglutamate--homocysteine methyltransferase